MEIKQAFLSFNAAFASTAQNVASGIEIAALQPGGISAIADSFQDIPPPQGAFDQPKQFADAAAFDLPHQYAGRLNDFQRDASGLVSSADLTKNLIDPNLNVLKEAGSFYKQLLSMRESKQDISAASKRIDENYNATINEIESNKAAREDSNSASLLGTIFGGPIIGTLIGGAVGESSNQSEEAADPIQQLMAQLQKAESFSDSIEKKRRDLSTSIYGKIG